MAQMAELSEKQQYEKCVQTILQIVMEIDGLSDGVWKEISDQCGSLWKLKESFANISVQANRIEHNRYYHRYIRSERPRHILSVAEKARNEKYTNCPRCDRIIKIGYMGEHQTESKVCIDITLVKSLTLKNQSLYNNKMKEFNLVNHWIVDRCKHIPTAVGVWGWYNFTPWEQPRKHIGEWALSSDRKVVRLN